ncbi:hypothetical protein L7F22_020174 [Adiantum nelumboides]|nr:hypothetical protein [Adiantum nelumboides]
MIWYFDSGASRHITSKKDLFCSLDAAPAGKKVTCANNASYPIKGVGKILITISDGSDLCLPDILYVPGIKKNLLFVSSLAKNGLRVIFEDDRCIVRDRENGYSLITTGTLENGLFVLDRYEKKKESSLVVSASGDSSTAKEESANFVQDSYAFLVCSDFFAYSVDETQMIWYFDSGASRHITSRKDLFCSLDAAPARKKVTCANNASYPIKGVGKILITISDGLDLCLPDILYVPGIKKNLLFVSSLAKNGLRVIFEDDRCIVRDRENGYSLITTGTLENGLFVLDRYEKQIQACIAKTKT